jgi:hypothetical protein
MKKKNKFNAKAEKGKRSQLEINCEKTLIEANIPFQYESFKTILFPAHDFCTYEVVKGEKKDKCKKRAIEYNIDFNCPNHTWFIESKGMALPDWVLKWKMFSYYMSIHYPNSKCYIVHSIKDLKSILPELIELSNTITHDIPASPS